MEKVKQLSFDNCQQSLNCLLAFFLCRNPSCSHEVEKETPIHLNFPPFDDVRQCHQSKCNMLATKL